MADTIRALPLILFLAIVFFPAVLTAVLLAAGLKARRRAALLTATPTSNIGMAQDGYVEFEGRIEAVGGRTIEAALTRAPCVWFHARVQEFKSPTGSGSASWSIVKEVTSDAPFLVRDQTGVCRVEPWGAEVTPTDKSQWYGATLTPSDRNPAKVGAAESTTPMVEISGTANTRFRYFEERIYDGDPLLVLGQFTTARLALALEAEEDEEEDEEDPGDGETDAGEDDALTDEDREAIADGERDDAIREQAEAITKAWIGRGAAAKPFILSTTLQAVDVAQSSMASQAVLTGAAVPAAIALFLLWVRFS